MISTFEDCSPGSDKIEELRAKIEQEVIREIYERDLFDRFKKSLEGMAEF